MDPELKPSGHAEEARAGSPGSPEQIGIIAVFGGDRLSIGGNDVDTLDAEARRPPRPRIPTQSASEQVSTHRNGGTVTDRKRKPVFAECRSQFAAGDCRLNAPDQSLRLDRHLAEPRQVVEQPAASARATSP